jgi:hypothetical protein
MRTGRHLYRIDRRDRWWRNSPRKFRLHSLAGNQLERPLRHSDCTVIRTRIRIGADNGSNAHMLAGPYLATLCGWRALERQNFTSRVSLRLLCSLCSTPRAANRRTSKFLALGTHLLNQVRILPNELRYGRLAQSVLSHALLPKTISRLPSAPNGIRPKDCAFDKARSRGYSEPRTRLIGNLIFGCSQAGRGRVLLDQKEHQAIDTVGPFFERIELLHGVMRPVAAAKLNSGSAMDACRRQSNDVCRF